MKKKECCKNSKNWRDYALIGTEVKSGPWVSYRCVKCKKSHGMDYGKYLTRLRKDNPDKIIYA